MNDHRTRDAITEADELVEAIRPVFAGRDPEVVGATLGQLLAILIAGHHPGLRDNAIKMIIDMVADLVPVEVEIMIDAGACGPDWRDVKH